MEINLRKADAIEKTAQQFLMSLSINPTVSVDKFTEISEIEKKGEKLFETVELKKKLVEVIYSIRAKKAAKQEEVGINHLLHTIVKNNKLIEVLQPIVNSSPIYSGAQMQKRLEDISKDNATAYTPKNFTSGVLTEERIDKAKEESAALTKHNRSIRDKLLDLNVSAKITLDPKEVVLLQEQNLL